MDIVNYKCKNSANTKFPKHYDLNLLGTYIGKIVKIVLFSPFRFTAVLTLTHSIICLSPARLRVDKQLSANIFHIHAAIIIEKLL